MDIKLSELESECDKLRNRLSCHEELQSEVEMLKEELETSLESHKKLQEVALAFEEENRCMQSRYTEQLKDKSKLDAVKIELEFEVENSKLSYEQLERKYNKMKDKIELIQEMEDQVYNLENEKRMNLEKIIELEESLNASYEDSDARTKELQDKIDKLARENSEVNSKLVTFIEEVEDMDTKMENLEKENEELKLNLEKMKEMEMFGSHMEQIEELESEKQELIEKLEKEKKRREDIENELFRTEEELEGYLCRDESYNKIDKCSKDINNNEDDGISSNSTSVSSSNASLPNINELSVEELDENSQRIVSDNQQMVHNLSNEKTLLLEKISSMEEELEVLLEENAMLAKANNDLQNSKLKDQEEFESKIAELQDRINELEDERKLLEQEKFKRIVSSAEKEYECSQKQKEEIRENERLKNELKVAQEYLGVSNTKNSELQVEMERKEKEYQERLDSVKDELKTELQSLKVSLEEGTLSKLEEKSHILEEERHKFLNQMETNMGKMKDEYEKKIIDQNSTISNLEEEIAIMRAMYENKSMSTTSSTGTPPVVISNGKCCSMVDIRCFRDAPLENSLTQRNGPTLGSDSTLANGYSHGDDKLNINSLSHAGSRTHGDGNSFRNGNLLRNGHHYESDVESDNGDYLSEREMRRISYKVAEGSWKRLSTEIPINQQNLQYIMNSKANGQEKVFQLLHCWTNESNISRTDLLKELTEYIDPNRKEVIRYLREMSGISTKDRNSIKTRFKKLKLSVKR